MSVSERGCTVLWLRSTLARVFADIPDFEIVWSFLADFSVFPTHLLSSSYLCMRSSCTASTSSVGILTGYRQYSRNTFIYRWYRSCRRKPAFFSQEQKNTDPFSKLNVRPRECICETFGQCLHPTKGEYIRPPTSTLLN